MDIQEALRRAAEQESAGDSAAAAATYREVLAVTGDNAGLVAALAASEARAGDTDGAERDYRRALQLDPGQSAVLVNLGVLLRSRGDLDECLALFERAVAAGGGAVALSNLALALHESGDLEAALARYEEAIALDPGLTSAHFNRANALADAGRLDEAAAAFRATLALDPQETEARWNLSHVLLRMGDYAGGFEAFEARWHLPPQQGPLDFLMTPRWRGETRPGATLLVWGEQGFGDVLQFVRYAPLAAARGLKVVLGAQPQLVDLLRSVEGVETVFGMPKPPPAHTWHCPVMSLPHVFGTSPANIPDHVPYLSAQPARVAEFARRLPDDGRLRVGVVWSSGIRRHSQSLYRVGIEKSLPGRLLDALALPGVCLVSLQLGSEHDPPGVPLLQFDADLRSFADTAALIEALDLVITVDTAVAHLAGALGKPVWILLNTQACWRWALAPDSSPWYPTARLYRQVHPGDWRAPLGAMEKDLRALAAPRAGRSGWLARLLGRR